jgi:hypothetical protein
VCLSCARVGVAAIAAPVVSSIPHVIARVRNFNVPSPSACSPLNILEVRILKEIVSSG